MRIACVGGGPAGLYFALLMKLSEPRHEITIFEKSHPGATRGWGVVFWDDLLKQLYQADPPSARQLEEASFHWDGQIVDVRGTQVRHPSLRGYRHQPAAPAGRLDPPGAGCRSAGRVRSRSDGPFATAGVGSRSRLRRSERPAIRLEAGDFQTDVQLGSNKYIWLGTDKGLPETFTFPFVPTESGWVWAHAYGIDAKTSTFIVECTAETYAGLGFGTMPTDACLSVLEKIFASHLDGHRLHRAVS